VDRIATPDDVAMLPRRLRLAVETTDVIVTDPSGMRDELRRELLDEFTADQVVELVLTTALASRSPGRRSRGDRPMRCRPSKYPHPRRIPHSAPDHKAPSAGAEEAGQSGS